MRIIERAGTMVVSFVACSFLVGCATTNAPPRPLIRKLPPRELGTRWEVSRPEVQLGGQALLVLPFKGSDGFHRHVEGILIGSVLHAESEFSNGSIYQRRFPKDRADLRQELVQKNSGLIPRVVTRSDLKTVLDEQDLQRTGLIDAATAVKVGKLVGARCVLMGEVVLEKSKLAIGTLWICKVKWAQLIDVETGTLIWSWTSFMPMTPMASSEGTAAHNTAIWLVGRSFFWHLKYK